MRFFIYFLTVFFATVSTQAKADCNAGKALLCSAPIAACGLTAGFGGRDPLYRCVAAGASWCLECLGFSDPRDNNTNEGGGAGVSCTGSKCGFSSLQSALTVGQAQPFGSANVAANEDGRLELVAVDSAGLPFHMWQSSPAGHWGQNGMPFPLAPTARSRPIVNTGSDGRLTVYYASKQGRLIRIRQAAPNVNWSTPEEIGFVDGEPAASTSDAGETAIAWISSTGTLKVGYIKDSIRPLSTTSVLISAGVVGVPALARNQDGRLEAFARRTDGSYMHVWQVDNESWSSATFDGQFRDDPQVNRNYDGRLELFGTSKAGTLRNIWQVAPNAGWSAWNDFPGAHQYTIASVIQTNGMLAVFAVGQKDRGLYLITQLIGGGWSNWSPLGGKMIAAPRAALNADGTLEVLGIGDDHAIWSIRQKLPNLPSWFDWRRLGGNPLVKMF